MLIENKINTNTEIDTISRVEKLPAEHDLLSQCRINILSLPMTPRYLTVGRTTLDTNLQYSFKYFRITIIVDRNHIYLIKN